MQLSAESIENSGVGGVNTSAGGFPFEGEAVGSCTLNDEGARGVGGGGLVDGDGADDETCQVRVGSEVG